MQIVPLVEGIEFLKLEYGIDDSPATVNSLTGLIGDGIPDSYVANPTAEQMASAVSMRIHLLARATEETVGFADAKTYELAGITTTATGDRYKRHVFTAEVRPMNLSGRREIPE